MDFAGNETMGKLMRLIRKFRKKAVVFVFLSGTYPVYTAPLFVFLLRPFIIKRDLGIFVIKINSIKLTPFKYKNIFNPIYYCRNRAKYLCIPTSQSNLELKREH